MARPLQAHGLRSKVYGPVLLAIFRERYVEGAARSVFTLEDVRGELVAMGLQARNAPDIIYRIEEFLATPMGSAGVSASRRLDRVRTGRSPSSPIDPSP